MKKIVSVFALIISLSGIVVASGCSSSMTAEERAARREHQALVDSVTRNLAVARLDAGEFLIPARSLQIGSGRNNTYPNDMTNFISAREGKGMFQLASTRGNRLGANGMGGITLEGVFSLKKRSTDKRGNDQWEYSLGTTLGLCRILVDLPASSATARVNVQGSFGPGSFTLTGPVLPYDRSSIAVGRSF